MRRKWLYVLLGVSIAGNLAAWGLARWRAGRWMRMYPPHKGVSILGFSRERLQPLTDSGFPAMDSLRRRYMLLDARAEVLTYDHAVDSGELAAALDELAGGSLEQYRLAIASARRAFAGPDSTRRARSVRRWREMMCLPDEGASRDR